MSVVLKAHQRDNVEAMLSSLRNFGGVLDGSDTGTGKTFAFLGLCKAVGARPAVVTRRAIIPSWEEACQLMGLDPVFITNYEQLLTDGFPYTRVERKPNPTAKSPNATVAVIKDWIIPEKRVLFCFDEAQALRSTQSFASKAALLARAKYKTALLSATPFSTPLEAGCIGQVIQLFNGTEYYRWLFAHGCRKDHFNRMKFIGDVQDNKKAAPGTNALKGREIMARIHETIFPSRGVRTRREDIPGFPETLIEVMSVETGEADAISKLYLEELAARQADDHARACADVDPDFHDLVDVLPVVRDLRYRQQAEMLKARSMAELAKLAREKGDSVALFVNFDSTIEMLSEYLECNAIVRGDGSGRAGNNYDRARNVRFFQENKIPYLILNSQAGGAGLSLQDPVTQKSRTSLISPPVSAVMLKQIFGRPQRLGGGYSTQKLIFAAGTVEERVLKRVQARLGNIDALLDSDLDVNG